MFLNWDLICVMFFSSLDWELWVWERKATEVRCHFHYIISKASNISIFILIALLRYCSPGFFNVHLTFFSPSVLYPLKGSHRALLTFKVWGGMLYCLQGRFFKKIIWNSSNIYVFNLLFITVLSVWRYIIYLIHTYYTLDYNPNLCYLFWCSNYSSLAIRSVSLGSCAPLTEHHLILFYFI